METDLPLHFIKHTHTKKIPYFYKRAKEVSHIFLSY